MKAFLYLATLAAAFSPAASGPKVDPAQLAFCEKVNAYVKAVTHVASLRAESSAAAVRKAQAELKRAYASIEQEADKLAAPQPATMRVAMAARQSPSPSVVQRLAALLDVSPAAANARKAPKTLVCVPAGVGARTEAPPPQYQLNYAAALRCGPDRQVAQIEMRNPMWVFGAEIPGLEATS
jgi:hypothetical protein